MHTIFADETDDESSNKAEITIFRKKCFTFKTGAAKYYQALNKFSDEFKEFSNAMRSNAKIFKSAAQFYGLVPHSNIDNQLKKVESNLAQTQQNIADCIKATKDYHKHLYRIIDVKIDSIEKNWAKIRSEHNKLFGSQGNNKIFQSLGTLAFHILLTEVDIAAGTDDGLNFKLNLV